MERCPICRAGLNGAEVCRRCRAELTGAAVAERTARRLEGEAMARLAQGKPEQARRLLSRALLLHRTSTGRLLLALCAV